MYSIITKDLVSSLKANVSILRLSNWNSVATNLSPNNSFEIIRMYPRTSGPIHLFGVLFYNLKDMDKENKLEKQFAYLKEFIDYEIDLFMIVNYLR